MKTYYLAGPMTGLRQHNFPAFESAAKELRQQGYDIKSPHEIDFGETEENRGRMLPYNYYLKESLKLLLQCDGIVMLPQSHLSRGARIELELAKNCGMEVWRYEPADRTLRRISG
jgi:hypothetical protein